MNNASKTIDEYLATLPDWQQANLVIFRTLVHEVEPDVKEDWKWNVPVFTLGGKMLFAMSGFKTHTKFNFMENGALLDDVDDLFNNGLDSKKSRAIDLVNGETINQAHLRALIAQSIALHISV